MVDKVSNVNNNSIKTTPAEGVTAAEVSSGDIGAHKQAAADVILRRNNRGCKSSDFYKWPDQPLDQMDSTLSVQQYIQQLIRKDPSDVDAILKPPEGQDLGAWKMEHLRQFCMQLNGLAVKLQSVCHPDTCNQMTATEQWIFLCAAHRQPNECPAIDYTRHTLDGASCLLNSNRYFPSRVTIKDSSVAKLGSVCRRVYRIFSHAFYHHRATFDEFESETLLCKRFTAFVTMYNLMANETLIVPIGGSCQITAVCTTEPTTQASSTNDPSIPTSVSNDTTATTGAEAQAIPSTTKDTAQANQEWNKSAAPTESTANPSTGESSVPTSTESTVIEKDST
ncbi:MOB-like protein phocein, partial [Fragariocoptes setiger]